MLIQEQVKPKKLRELTPAELMLVAGGGDTVVITGSRDWYDYDPYAYFDYFFGYNDYSDYSDGGGGSTSSSDTATDDLHAENTKAAVEKVQAVTAALQDIVNHYGPDVQVQLPNHDVVRAGDLLEGLGKLETGIAAGITLGEVLTGQADIKEAFNFAFGVAVESMAAEAGASAVVAFALGYTSEYVASNILDWMDQMGQANQAYQQYFNDQLQTWVQNNSDISPGAYDNQVDMLRGMFGWPTFREYDVHYQ
jgi:hypothetical protein